MRIKNLDKIKELVKSKLPEYLEELNCKTNSNKVQCPNTKEHDHGDKNKLSAAFLPDSQNKLIYCFVEDRTFDIFDVYAMKTGKNIKGAGFFVVLKELCEKYGFPLEEEYEYSVKEKEIFRQRKFLENLHKVSLNKDNLKRGLDYYKKRNLDKEKITTWKIGCISPDDITPEINKACKNLFDYRLLSVLHTEALVIPLLDENKQYQGLILRMFDSTDDNPYIKICIKGSQLFNIERVRGKEEIIVTEGVFDAISLHPKQNVVACLTNVVTDANLEKIAGMGFKRIYLALDPDNFFKGSVRDGFLRTILRMKNLDTEIQLIKIPVVENKPKADPDEYMKNHTLEEFNNLPKIPVLTYLLQNHSKEIIKPEVIYDFVAGCPNLIRKEAYISECAKELGISKRQLTRSIDNMSDNKTSFNMIQYVQEKDSFEELLEEFTEMAWNKNYSGIPSGFPLFDKKFGGFEDTLYLFAAFPEQGKSTMLLNFAYRLACYEKVFVAFYSLDDGAKRSVVPRLMSIASGLSSKKSKQPDKDFEKDWFEGMNRLQSLKENLIIKDGSQVRTIDDLDNFIKIHSTIAEEKGKKFVVIIDNLHDLIASGKRDLESTQNSQRIASYLKRLPQIINCPIIATAEVPKSAGSKPTGRDIKESIDLWYAARFVAGVYSDFHQAKNKQDTNLHWMDTDGSYNPIIEIFVSKNQTGDATHGSLFYKFSFKNNTLTECNERELQALNDGQLLSFME